LHIKIMAWKGESGVEKGSRADGHPIKKENFRSSYAAPHTLSRISREISLSCAVLLCLCECRPHTLDHSFHPSFFVCIMIFSTLWTIYNEFQDGTAYRR
jgi:hypothetical protein